MTRFAGMYLCLVGQRSPYPHPLSGSEGATLGGVCRCCPHSWLRSWPLGPGPAARFKIQNVPTPWHRGCLWNPGGAANTNCCQVIERNCILLFGMLSDGMMGLG